MKTLITLFLSFFCFATNWCFAQRPGLALQFQGGQYASCPLEFPNAQTTFSLDFRFKSNRNSPNFKDFQRVLCWNDGSKVRLEFGLDRGTLQAFLYSETGISTPGGMMKGKAGMADGEWHHVAFSQHAETWEFWVDGQQVATASGRFSPGKVLLLGKWYHGGEFTGLIDEVRAWATDLSLPQFSQNTPEPLVWYDFNGNIVEGSSKINDKKGLRPLALYGFGSALLVAENSRFEKTPSPSLEGDWPMTVGKALDEIGAGRFSATDALTFIVKSKSEPDTYFSLDFVQAARAEQYGGDGIPIPNSDRYLEVDSTELDKEEVAEYAALRSTKSLRSMEDDEFWAVLQTGTFKRQEDGELQTFDVAGPYNGLFAKYEPLKEKTLSDYGIERSNVEHRILSSGMLSNWYFDEAEAYSLGLFHVAGGRPFALIFDDDGYVIGYVLVTNDGPLMALDDCEGLDCGWRFEEMPHRQYLDWKHEQRWQTSDRFKVFDKLIQTDGPLLVKKGLRDTVTGIVVLPAAFDEIRLSNLHVVAMNEGRGASTIYDSFLRPVLVQSPKGPKIKAVSTRLESSDGLQLVLGKELVWLTPKGELEQNPVRNRPVYGVCGTVDYWRDSIGEAYSLIKTFESYHSSLYGSEHSSKYKLDFIMYRQGREYTDFQFLNGQKSQDYSGNSGITAQYDRLPYSTLIAQRKDGLFDLISLEKKDDQLDFGILLEGLETVQPKGNYHPLFFKKNGKWGIYPAMKTGEFLRIEPFDFFFAKAYKSESDWGWLGLDGVFVD
ncbi:MAG: LamG domain-containing protein [Saprospiraceae bacterium]|nr:LamG domain-containing protein [Saprospiraceae bacterium]